MRFNNLRPCSRITHQLDGDNFLDNTVRKVSGFYVRANPECFPKAQIIHTNTRLGEYLGFTKEQLYSKKILDWFSGQFSLPTFNAYAQNYGGHQFGQWAGQLGDGRAIVIGETQNNHEIQLKGAGPTTFSRRGDGYAVLRSSLREYLLSEAMHHLGVPTTGALALIETGQKVARDREYNGNVQEEMGAIVVRTASSFVRFGSFELFAARKDYVRLKQLADYIIMHYYPQCEKHSATKYIAFFNEVAQRHLDLVLHWQRLGFVHAVLNTDNVSILGLTIDYGPFSFLDHYQSDWTPNTSDSAGRYAFGEQGQIILWNLYMLANSLFPLIGEAKPFEQIVNQFAIDYERRSLKMLLSKLGLTEEGHKPLVDDLLELMSTQQTDWTIFFRELSKVNIQDTRFTALDKMMLAFYHWPSAEAEVRSSWHNWFAKYLVAIRRQNVSDKIRAKKMNAVNPKYILRNYLLQQAIELAEKGDYSEIDQLFILCQHPYKEQPEWQKYYGPRPAWANNHLGSARLSCSS